MTSQLDQAILRNRPIVYWKGARSEDASSIDVRDLSRSGYHAISQSRGGHADLVPISLPGDDSYRRGWRGMNTGYFQSVTGTAIPGFSAVNGTIICFARILATVSQNSQGLFDTKPASVGAVRIYTSNNWSTVNFENGGDTGRSVSGATWIRKGEMQMFSVAWHSTNQHHLFIDGKLADSYTNIISGETNQLLWGSVNENSFRGRADFHSLIVFDRFLGVGEQAAIYKAAMYSTGNGQPNRLGRR